MEAWPTRDSTCSAAWGASIQSEATFSESSTPILTCSAIRSQVSTFRSGPGSALPISLEWNLDSRINSTTLPRWERSTLAQQIPNVPGALEAFGFGGQNLFNSLNGAIQANGGLIRSQFVSVFRSQGSSSIIDGLSVEGGDQDYYRSESTQPGLEGRFVNIAFDHDLGDLRLSLLTWSGNLADPAQTLELLTAKATLERISLAGLPAGVYYLLVEVPRPRRAIPATAWGSTAPQRRPWRSCSTQLRIARRRSP